MFNRKWIPLLMMLLALTLAACRGSTPQGEVETPDPFATDAAPAETQPVEPLPTQAIAPTAPQVEPAAGESMQGCTAVSVDASREEVESLFPPASEDDWVHGPADASVTIMEYSDFQ
jgi:hypothetical protein